MEQKKMNARNLLKTLERETGIEPATFQLGKLAVN